MLQIVLTREEYKQLLEGNLKEVHKEITKYYTSRLTKYFGVIGNETNVKEIGLIPCSYVHDNSQRRVASCTVRIQEPVKGMQGKSKEKPKEKTDFSKIPKNKPRYVLDIKSIRDFNPETDAAINNKKNLKMSEIEVVQNLKKIELCMERKASGCDQNCSDCPQNVIESVLKTTVITAMSLLNTGINSNYDTGYKTGYKRAFEEIMANKDLKVIREVINTEGYAPYCQVCRTTTAIYSRDGRQNIFCGKCGALLNWESVNYGMDNYEKIKANASIYQGMNIHTNNYYKRKKAIEEFVKEHKPLAKSTEVILDPPEEAKIRGEDEENE